LEDCRRIGQTIAAEADSVIARALGLGLQGAAGADSEQYLAARRSHEWRLQQFSALDARMEAEPALLTAYYRDVLDTNSEVRAQELLLARAGIALEPPADWKPASLRAD
jgi:hypothetical protein